MKVYTNFHFKYTLQEPSLPGSHVPVGHTGGAVGLRTNLLFLLHVYIYTNEVAVSPCFAAGCAGCYKCCTASLLPRCWALFAYTGIYMLVVVRVWYDTFDKKKAKHF